MKRRALTILAIAIAAVLALCLRVVLAGRDALAAGDTAAAQGRLDDAIDGWSQAARWYLPFAPHVDDAYARLAELAARDHAHALPAWRAIRSAALATRTLWTPHADDLARADAQIAELASRDPAGAASGGPDAATRKTWHVAQLARVTGPSRLAAALALLGIAAWLGGIAFVLRRGLDDGGRLVRRAGLLGGCVAAAGLAMWLLAVLAV